MLDPNRKLTMHHYSEYIIYRNGMERFFQICQLWHYAAKYRALGMVKPFIDKAVAKPFLGV